MGSRWFCPQSPPSLGPPLPRAPSNHHAARDRGRRSSYSSVYHLWSPRMSPGEMAIHNGWKYRFHLGKCGTIRDSIWEKWEIWRIDHTGISSQYVLARLCFNGKQPTTVLCGFAQNEGMGSFLWQCEHISNWKLMMKRHGVYDEVISSNNSVTVTEYDEDIYIYVWCMNRFSAYDRN